MFRSSCNDFFDQAKNIYVLSKISNESIIPCDVTDQEMYGSSYSIGEDGQLSNLHAQHNAIHQIRELCHK